MRWRRSSPGARKTYGLNLIGGIRRDLLKNDMIETRQLAQQMRRDVQELVDMLLSTPNIGSVPWGSAALIGDRP